MMNELLQIGPAVDVLKESISGGHQICVKCGFDHSDVQVLGCGCSFHARCLYIPNQPPLAFCPQCSRPVTGLSLYPMSFNEIDEARKEEASMANKRKGKKRKEPSSSDNLSDPSQASEFNCRTGRWTNEEMNLCDKMIEMFTAGSLPLSDGTRLNDFLATMLKSKQSRLTKKMKNANLSGKTFKKDSGYIADIEQCKQFSHCEDAFFQSLISPVERAEIRFHMQKEWRELFSSFCVSLGQSLDADQWLSTVEEKEKRESMAKDAIRLARRKKMMGIALTQDGQNPEQGVFVDMELSGQGLTGHDSNYTTSLENDDFLSLLHDKSVSASSSTSKKAKPNNKHRHCCHYSSPFLGTIISYLQRHQCPFEHVDAWVPSFVPDSEANQGSGTDQNSTCRLCFAGSATSEVQVPMEGVGSTQLLSSDEQYNLLSFGDYSQKFSFNVGCGLPGRVYESGVPAWEQSVHNAPHNHFERCGGAIQWGIKTVVGIPVPSPTVGRIVVVAYSVHDRQKDQELVGRLYEEFRKLVPSPKWKLVVDIGSQPIQKGQVVNQNSTESEMNTKQVEDLVALLGQHMPHNQSYPHAAHLSEFMSCRLMLLKPLRTQEEEDAVSTLMSSYNSYLRSGRDESDIAMMIARDFTFLKQQQQQHQPQSNNLLISNAPAAPTPLNSGIHPAQNFTNSGNGNSNFPNQPIMSQQNGKLSQMHHFNSTFMAQQETGSNDKATSSTIETNGDDKT
jgi:hypothetical protein